MDLIDAFTISSSLHVAGLMALYGNRSGAAGEVVIALLFVVYILTRPESEKVVD